MNHPKNVKVLDTELATLWKDETGLLFSSAKKDAPINIDNIKEFYKTIRELSNGNKICLINDISKIAYPDKPSRDYIAAEAEINIKAVALITKSPISIVIGKAMLIWYRFSFPARLFTNEKEAKAWLKEYL